jgi:hypothetical protein
MFQSVGLLVFAILALGAGLTMLKIEGIWFTLWGFALALWGLVMLFNGSVSIFRVIRQKHN